MCTKSISICFHCLSNKYVALQYNYIALNQRFSTRLHKSAPVLAASEQVEESMWLVQEAGGNKGGEKRLGGEMCSDRRQGNQ